MRGRRYSALVSSCRLTDSFCSWASTTKPSPLLRLCGARLLRPKVSITNLASPIPRRATIPTPCALCKPRKKKSSNDGEVIQLTGLSLYLAGKPADAIPYLEKVQTWYPRANIDAAYVQTKKYSEGGAAFAKMFACRRIRPPRICSPLACCFVSISDRSRRNTD
jgi:hypothetical protein